MKTTVNGLGQKEYYKLVDIGTVIGELSETIDGNEDLKTVAMFLRCVGMILMLELWDDPSGAPSVEGEVRELIEKTLEASRIMKEGAESLD